MCECESMRNWLCHISSCGCAAANGAQYVCTHPECNARMWTCMFLPMWGVNDTIHSLSFSSIFAFSFRSLRFQKDSHFLLPLSRPSFSSLFNLFTPLSVQSRLLFTPCLALFPSQSMSHIINAYSFSLAGLLKSTVGSTGWWLPTWKQPARLLVSFVSPHRSFNTHQNRSWSLTAQKYHVRSNAVYSINSLEKWIIQTYFRSDYHLFVGY